MIRQKKQKKIRLIQYHVIKLLLYQILRIFNFIKLKLKTAFPFPTAYPSPNASIKGNKLHPCCLTLDIKVPSFPKKLINKSCRAYIQSWNYFYTAGTKLQEEGTSRFHVLVIHCKVVGASGSQSMINECCRIELHCIKIEVLH